MALTPSERVASNLNLLQSIADRALAARALDLQELPTKDRRDLMRVNEVLGDILDTLRERTRV
jgi:hypothetical protein